MVKNPIFTKLRFLISDLRSVNISTALIKWWACVKPDITEGFNRSFIMTKKGQAWVYGDNVDTDVIIPARYLNTSDAKELAKYCMEDIDTTFAQEVKQGDIMIAGENFGCGSSREHAPISIKEAGISVVIAKTFARIFFRNAINIGLPILENDTLPDEVKRGDSIEVDLENGIVKNLTTGKEYQTPKYSGSIQKLIEVGGLVNYTKDKLSKA